MADLIERLRDAAADAAAEEYGVSGLLREAAAALEAAREDGWQPIETAPKDGTRVLLWIEWSDVPVVGEFSHGRWQADTEHYSVSCGAGCYGGSVSSDRYMKPTHWRPLPAPPAIVKDTGEQS